MEGGSVDLSNFYSSGDFFVTFCVGDKKLRFITRWQIALQIKLNEEDLLNFPEVRFLLTEDLFKVESVRYPTFKIAITVQILRIWKFVFRKKMNSDWIIPVLAYKIVLVDRDMKSEPSSPTDKGNPEFRIKRQIPQETKKAAS